MITPIRFSVVIPFDGNPELLVETIDSIFNQSYKNWDLTVIDDGTNLKLETYLQGYLDRVNIVVLPQKVGIVEIFDLAIDALVGDFGMILGADDVLEQEFLFHMAQAWNKYPTVSLIHPKVITINGDSKIHSGFLDQFKRFIAPTNFKGVLKGRLLTYSLVIGNWMYFTSSTFKVKLLKELRFKADLKIAMDWDLALRMAMSGHSFGYSNQSIFYYRRHRNSFSMREDTSSIRLKEELGVLRCVGSVAREKRQLDIWFISKLHFCSQLNYIFRKISSHKKI